MYVTKSLINGLKILGFDKETIKEVSKEKKLEEIFISTLFLNYVIVMVIYLMSLGTKGVFIDGKQLDNAVLFGLLMVYPFLFNLIVYMTYGFFGLMAELLDNRKHVKPILEVGFHTAIVYTIIIYIIGIFAMFDTRYALFLLTGFLLFFIYTMFLTISTIYGFSLGKTLIVLLIPFLIIFMAMLVIFVVFPQTPALLINFFFY